MVLESTVKPCDFVLFGTKGDLARRKLLPSLYQLEKTGLIHQDTRIIGVARNEMSLDEYVALVKENIEKFSGEALCQDTWQQFSAKLDYVKVDMKDTASYGAFKEHVDASRTMVCYLATPPAIYGDICKGLYQADIIDASMRVVLEKPIGHDFASSQVINDQVAEYFNENQIYRIDHYLGKETVLNLIALRFANSLFATNWDHNCIDHVQISVAESVGIEGRWGYFDEAGQMRDMVQNHLLQILSLIAMEPPTDLNADSIRDEKLKVLKALRPINSHNIADKTVRGQYTSGFVKGEEVPGYLEEPDANQKSGTETFVAMKVELDNWRWAGVPFYLRTGKRMPTKSSEIVIVFKPQPHNLFKESFKELPPNKLTIRLQPDEGVEVTVMNKVPGLTGSSAMDLQKTKLNLSFSETFQDERIADAYEKLLLEVMMGNQALFVRRDEVEQAWSWVDSIIEAWESSNEPPEPYQAGTWGPVASIALMARDERNWVESSVKKKK
ncbi:Glucose-6-phosphate dehydrogenase (NADP(+)) [Saliniradius amylolyticus]|uniref:Glucose-6-phosphate 1-dehydrogenase n=1 Tax=Saliniradius amylolyticus TaxID=2183582 RepID=A0A2S2E3C2_9ALTE|nr:glucose-6-phosphate dehydrogenase [Saliniradius amylolyticus]AWL12141.1 Glucose-6-phosphate dehydrogenase (NADP(+)) [Saliniradius amylolyticus]